MGSFMTLLAQAQKKLQPTNTLTGPAKEAFERAPGSASNPSGCYCAFVRAMSAAQMSPAISAAIVEGEYPAFSSQRS